MSNDPTLWNYVSDTTEVYGDVPAAFETLVDLGTDYIFRRFMVYSTLDAPVIVRFQNPVSEVWSELEVPAPSGGAPGFSMVLDEFRHQGNIEWKRKASAPTAGEIKFVSWRGE